MTGTRYAGGGSHSRPGHSQRGPADTNDFRASRRFIPGAGDLFVRLTPSLNWPGASRIGPLSGG
jgi:hypothetical protein